MGDTGPGIDDDDSTELMTPNAPSLLMRRLGTSQVCRWSVMVAVALLIALIFGQMALLVIGHVDQNGSTLSTRTHPSTINLKDFVSLDETAQRKNHDKNGKTINATDKAFGEQHIKVSVEQSNTVSEEQPNEVSAEKPTEKPTCLNNWTIADKGDCVLTISLSNDIDVKKFHIFARKYKAATQVHVAEGQNAVLVNYGPHFIQCCHAYRDLSRAPIVKSVVPILELPHDA